VNYLRRHVHVPNWIIGIWLGLFLFAPLLITNLPHGQTQNLLTLGYAALIMLPLVSVLIFSRHA